MKGKIFAGTVATFCLAAMTLAPIQAAAQQNGPGVQPNGIVAPGAQNAQQNGIGTPGAQNVQSNGIARSIASTWGDATAMQENFNFGNPVSTSTANLPQQVQDAITVGETEAYLMSATIFGN